MLTHVLYAFNTLTSGKSRARAHTHSSSEPQPNHLTLGKVGSTYTITMHITSSSITHPPSAICAETPTPLIHMPRLVVVCLQRGSGWATRSQGSCAAACSRSARARGRAFHPGCHLTCSDALGRRSGIASCEARRAEARPECFQRRIHQHRCRPFCAPSSERAVGSPCVGQGPQCLSLVAYLLATWWCASSSWLAVRLHRHWDLAAVVVP